MTTRTFLAWQPSPAPPPPKPRDPASSEIIDISDNDTGTLIEGRGTATAPLITQRAASGETAREASASPVRASDVAGSLAGSIPSLTSSPSNTRASSVSSSSSLPSLALVLASQRGRSEASIQSSSPGHLASGTGYSGHDEDDFKDVDSVISAVVGGEAAGRRAGTLNDGSIKNQHRGCVETNGSPRLRTPAIHAASALADSGSDSGSSFDDEGGSKSSDRQWPINKICGVRTRRGKKFYRVRWADTKSR